MAPQVRIVCCNTVNNHHTPRSSHFVVTFICVGCCSCAYRYSTPKNKIADTFAAAVHHVYALNTTSCKPLELDFSRWNSQRYPDTPGLPGSHIAHRFQSTYFFFCDCKSLSFASFAWPNCGFSSFAGFLVAAGWPSICPWEAE